MENIEQELRFYCFVNFYLSSMQQGIQTGHCSVELVMKYLQNGNPFDKSISDDQVELVRKWADTYKTYIILNGGDYDGTSRLDPLVASSGFPFARFFESEGALKGLQTCIGVVLPECVFNAKPGTILIDEDGEEVDEDGEPVTAFIYEKLDDEGRIDLRLTYTKEHELYPFIEALKSCGLAK